MHPIENGGGIKNIKTNCKVTNILISTNILINGHIYHLDTGIWHRGTLQTVKTR